MFFNATKLTERQVQALKRTQARRGLFMPARRGECVVLSSRRGAVDTLVCHEGDGYYFNRPLSIVEKERRRVEADQERRRQRAGLRGASSRKRR